MLRVDQFRSWFTLRFGLDAAQRESTRRAWHKLLRQLQDPNGRWRRVKGPAGATVATLLDLGWAPLAPDALKAYHCAATQREQGTPVVEVLAPCAALDVHASCCWRDKYARRRLRTRLFFVTISSNSLVRVTWAGMLGL